jgi:hypothetical protein
VPAMPMRGVRISELHEQLFAAAERIMARELCGGRTWISAILASRRFLIDARGLPKRRWADPRRYH